MLKLVWRSTALDSLDDIIAYISDRDFGAGERLQSIIEACAERLPDHPYMYRLGREPGTRERWCTPITL